MGNAKLRFAVHAVLATAAATAIVPSALGQTAAVEDSSNTGSIAEVVVTGSRLQLAPNDVSISPVNTISSLDIAQTGLVRTEDLLNNLPQVVAENGGGQSISSNGTSTVSLRGLQSQRTLVLVNGRRMSPGAGLSTSTASVDINQIPADLIERADVLTGGASAVYGADAVAGVVNFVLNTHFEGVRVDANYGFGRHSNDNAARLGELAAGNQPTPDKTVDAGFNKDVSVIMGSNFADGRGNATVYFTYLHSTPAVGYQYDYAGCTLNTPASLPSSKTKLACGGSSSSATGRFLDLGTVGTSAYSTLADVTVDKTTGQARPYSGATDSYNYGALSYLQRGAERYTSGAFLTYDLNDNMTAYSEFMFARNTSEANYGPSGLFAFGTPSISCSNPLFNASELAAFCTPGAIASNQATFGGTGDRITLYAARRSVESGPRIDNYTSNAFHETMGLKGKFLGAFSYDAYGSIGINNMADVEGGFLGTQQVNNALDVLPNPATGGVKGVAAGAPVCASQLNGSDPNCVPWNIWNTGGVTAEQLKYLTVASSYNVKTTEYIANASVTGDFGKFGVQLPTASSGLQANVGTEYREERYDFDPDYIFGNGFASGGNGKFSAVHGGFHVSEIFTEARMPILDNVPGAYNLAAEAGYRYSSYTSGFNTNTFKGGLEWAPIESVRLRGGYNRAVRAPSVGDLFNPAVIGAGGTADPCWGAADANGLVNGHTAAFCANTGVTAAEFGHILANPAAQINTSSGGNPELKPEIADTYTAGVVFSPIAVHGLVVSVDYYSIKIKQTIETLSSNTVINNCGLSGDASLCSLIHRGAGTGSLWFNTTNFVNTTERNIGQLSTKGIDIAAHYAFDIGPAGKLQLGIAGSRTLKFLTQPLATGAAYDCVGYYGTTCNTNNSPTPAWKHTATLNWLAPWAGIDVSAKWRYIGPLTSDRVSQDPQLAQTYFAPYSHIGGVSYLDLSVAMPLAESGVSLRVGVNNITDKSPPIIPNGNYSDCPNLTCNANTFVGTYDTLGRYLYAHVTAKF